MERDIDQDMKRYDRMRQIARIDKLGTWLDARYRIPGTKIRFGGDALMGFIPGVGDTLSLLLASYIVKQAHSLDLPAAIKARMVWNVFVDWAIGLVPVVGDLLDIGYRGNLKNVELIQRHVNNEVRAEEPGPEVIEIRPRKVS